MRHSNCERQGRDKFAQAMRDTFDGIRDGMRHGMRHGGPFGGRPEGGPRGRGGERRRMFESGELRLVLLKLIEEQPRHGYDLIREIETLSGGAYAPSPGVVYPTMTLLLDMGLADEQASDGPRKLLGISEAGRQHLIERADEVFLDDVPVSFAYATLKRVLDLAGVRLEAKEEGVVLEGAPSRLFFSVSEWQGRDYRGDAHFIWPRPAGEP